MLGPGANQTVRLESVTERFLSERVENLKLNRISEQRLKAKLQLNFNSQNKVAELRK